MKLILGNFLSILIFLSIVAYPVMAQETTVDPTNQDVVDPSNSYQRYDEREQTPFQVNRENLPPLDDGLIWDQLGSLSDAPLEIQRGSNLQKAQYFFKKYCNYLREIGAPVNEKSRHYIRRRV